MSTTTKLLDGWKKHSHIVSDNQAAIRLGVTRARVSLWRSQDTNAEAHVIERMATDLGLDPPPYILAAQAEKTVKTLERNALMRAAKKLGYAAALAIALSPAITQCAEVYNSAFVQGSVYYVKFKIYAYDR